MKNTLKNIDLESMIFEDERGWVINPFEAASIPYDKVGNLHAVSMHPGMIRGNHSHPDAREWLVVFDGPALVIVRTNNNGQIDTLRSEEGKPAMIEIPPGAEHAIKNISDKDIFLLSFGDNRERQTLRCENLFDIIR